METPLILTPNTLPPDLTPVKTQARASNPATSVWVNASAGSGKTRVLTNRVIRLLLSGVSPQRILCLTFTKAAAAEMAIRVTTTLGRWAVCSEDELREELSALQDTTPAPDQFKRARRLFAHVLACPGGLRIHTIHAFCQEILHRFPIEASLPPHFTVIDEADAAEAEDTALTTLLQKAADYPESSLGRALHYLVTEFGEKGLHEALENLLKDRVLFEAARQKADGLEALFLKMRELLELPLGATHTSIVQEAIAELPEDDVREIARSWLLGTPSYKERGEYLLEWLTRDPAGRAENFADFMRLFLKAEGGLFTVYGDKKLLASAPNLDTYARCEAKRLMRVYTRLAAVRVAEGTEALLRFGSELIVSYENYKARRAVLDYSDLVTRTAALLQREGIAPWVLFKLDGGLDHILVDEAQDTSREQWQIIATLAEDFFSGQSARDTVHRTLFVVGDEKQSIFSFQRADPEAFAAMRFHFSERIQAAEKDYHEEPLQISFRSAPAILRLVDAVFASDAARVGVSQITVHHNAFHTQKIGHIEVWPLLTSVGKKDASEEQDDVWYLPLASEEEHDPQAQLADIIADTISSWLLKGETLEGENRKLVAGDIMILLRRRGRFADLMVRALKKRNVPVTGVDRMRLVKQLPVMDLLALIQFVLLPEDDLTLASLLRSPLLNLSEEDLMHLALGSDGRGRKGTLWEALRETKESHMASCRDYLEHSLALADFTTPYAFLARVLTSACPGSNISGKYALWQRLGPDALDPLQELLTAAQDFSHRHTPSLEAFLHWLTVSDSDIKRELDHGDEGGGQVRIMTVHAAKGLEAPVVFLPDTAGIPRAQDVNELLWWTSEAQSIPFYLPHRPDFGVPRELWQAARDKQMEEYRRLLYVALTRASNRLYVGGWENARSDGDMSQSWYALIAGAIRPLHHPMFLNTTPIHAALKFTDILCFADPCAQSSKDNTNDDHAVGLSKAPPIPDWVYQSAPEETKSTRLITPSHFLVDEAGASMFQNTVSADAAFARGRLIHRLLQILPEVAPATRRKIAQRFVASPLHALEPSQQDEIVEEVIRLLEDPNLVQLFGPDSRAEVPLVGRINGQPIPGQIDRLCVRGNDVWILDYKTNRPPPDKIADVPLAYRAQLSAYRTVLTEIYPGKTVRCFLLWTYRPQLMELPRELLLFA